MPIVPKCHIMMEMHSKDITILAMYAVVYMIVHCILQLVSFTFLVIYYRPYSVDFLCTSLLTFLRMIIIIAW